MVIVLDSELRAAWAGSAETKAQSIKVSTQRTNLTLLSEPIEERELEAGGLN
jgi:hypothetical protein